MEWFVHALRKAPELGLFLALALGYGIGKIRFGRFQLGAAPGTLIAGILVGQLAVTLPNAMKSAFFLMFLFALGFRTGPEFFRSLRSARLVHLALIATVSITAIATALVIARVLHLDGGTAAGLLAGSMTNSTALGSATEATQGLPLDAADAARLAGNVATTYALTYLFGLIGVVLFLPNVGPWLMRVNLREVSHAFERSQGLSGKSASVNATYGALRVRTYRIAASMDGVTVAALEAHWHGDRRVVVTRLRRAGFLIDTPATMALKTDDVVALAGRPGALIGAENPLAGQEVDDSELLQVPTISADLVVTASDLTGRTLGSVAEQFNAREIFLLSLRRGGQQLPFTPATIVERGDVLKVSGTQTEIARVAAQVGFVEYPTSKTDLMIVAATILLGGLVGLPALAMGRLTLSLGVPVGVLLGGLLLGNLSSIHPRFGRVPEPSVWLLESLGLTAFLAIVGLQAGPAMVEAFQRSGGTLIAAGLLITVTPYLVTILLGYYVAGIHPAILLGLCAGAGTSATALAAVEEAADSHVPALGYGLACAAGNFLLALGGTLIVLVIGG